MLPDGKLSLHGYTKSWGFFNGTCYGARELPFEKSKDLVDRAIAMAQQSAINYRDEADKREAMRSADDVYYLVLVKGRGRRSWFYGQELKQGKLVKRENLYYFLFDHEGEKREEQVHKAHMDIRDVIRDLNQEQAKRIRCDAYKADNYVRWQQSRIKGWKVKPLTPRDTK